MDIYKEIFLMQQTYATLFAIANKIQIEGDKSLDKLTTRQNMAMIAIAHLKEDETSINNVARKLGTSKQSAKQLITILEDKGYIVMRSSLKDKRAVNLIITEEGKQAAIESAEKGLYFFTELFREFSCDELQLLWEMLKKLYRFNGEEQDGFEEDTDVKLSDEQLEIQERAVKEFERLRKERSRDEYEKK